ncbi:hypothetical protein N8474_00130 [Gammaproteobacteria bacterium]|nr:hypothetical protein [Gammaproteobacteria bacterium]
MKKDKVVYTALIGKGDSIPKINFNINNDIEYVCFTDNPDLVPQGWLIEIIDDSFKKNNLETFLNNLTIKECDQPTMINRIIKMHPHIFLKNYKKSMYIDAHIRIKKCMSKFIDDSLVEYDWLSPPHRWGGDTLIECHRCYENNKINKNEFSSFLEKVKEFSIPKKTPFPENGVILRNHFDQNVKSMCDEWWRLFKDGPYRDQLHWQHAFMNTSPKFGYLPYRFVDDNPYYKLGRHKGWPLRLLKKKVIKSLKKFFVK